MDAGRPDDHIRLGELMAALSVATDLGLGQPVEHELEVCLSAVELAERLGCTPAESSDVYYVALLAHVGCTAAAPYFASWVGGDEVHFQSSVQDLGPAAEPSEDMRYLGRRFADDRPLPEGPASSPSSWSGARSSSSSTRRTFARAGSCSPGACTSPPR
jgi:hypothetical protein